MSLLLWAVVLSSTLAWALFDVLRKRLAGKMRALELSFWLSALQVPFFAVWWLVAPSALAPDALWTPAYLGPAALSMVFNVAANLFFLSAVGRADLGATIPLLSLTPVFVALGSLPLPGERLGVRNWAGILLVTLGALFLPDAGTTRPTLRQRFSALLTGRSSSFMVATAALWALTPVCDKLALAQVPAPVHATLLAVGVALGTAVMVALRGEAMTRASARTSCILVGAAAVSVLALGLQFVAISTVVVSTFEAFKRAFGLLLAFGFGALVFRERLTSTRLAAGGIMALGVVLVLWSPA